MDRDAQTSEVEQSHISCVAGMINGVDTAKECVWPNRDQPEKGIKASSVTAFFGVMVDNSPSRPLRSYMVMWSAYMVILIKTRETLHER
ncbi:hypothetical protein DDD63_08420 [Actinobaculum sp. 313]|nr:hypothetical protein DDD63_08420 [Actinobaculum sp. 313]